MPSHKRRWSDSLLLYWIALPVAVTAVGNDEGAIWLRGELNILGPYICSYVRAKLLRRIVSFFAAAHEIIRLPYIFEAGGRMDNV